MPESQAPWRVLIADDEPPARRGLRRLLAPYEDFVVAGECRDGGEALAALERGGVEVLFLDIRMPELDGFGVLAERPAETLPAVVFLTAFEAFAVEAFAVEALDYLVKPVSESRFAATMGRLRRHLAGGRGRRTTLTASSARGTVVLDLDDIEWVEAADNYARVWIGGKGTLVRRSLDELEELLANRGFLRAHRQALVKLDAVRLIEGSGAADLFAHLASGIKVRISRRRRAAFTAAVRGR